MFPIVSYPPSSPGGNNGDLQYNNNSDFGGFADGTSHQVLHGGKTFGAVDLTADVSGVLPPANGGVAAVTSTGEGYWFPEPYGESLVGKAFSTNNTIAATANRVYMAQTVLRQRQKISFFTFATGSGGGITAGNNFGYAIYDHNGQNRLATINVAGAVATSTAVRTAIAETTVTLDPSVYWVAWVCTLTTTTMNSYTNNANGGLFGNVGGSVIRWGHAGASNSSVAGSLPSSIVIPNTFLAQPFPIIFCEP